jgi:hypothetical protein
MCKGSRRRFEKSVCGSYLKSITRQHGLQGLGLAARNKSRKMPDRGWFVKKATKSTGDCRWLA